MKLVGLILLFSLSVFAEDMEKKEVIEEHKKKMISHIDERIEQLTKAKGCFNSASKKEEMEGCRKELRSGMKGIKSSWKEERSAFRAKREELRASKKEEKLKLREELKAKKLNP